MSELEERLDRLLSDPAELEKIGRIAAQFMGGGDAPADGPDGAGAPAPAGGDDKSALLSALAPFLQPERRQKLRRALRLARAAKAAGAALEAFGLGDV